MSLSQTRFGANALGLPGPTPMPSLSTALSRRSAIFGAVTVAGFTAVPAVGRAAALSSNDARLVAIAAELQAVDERLNVLSAAHANAEKSPEWDALIDRFEPLEEEMAATPADTLAGVLAKARAAQVPTVFHCVNGIADSVTADLVRLGSGALS